MRVQTLVDHILRHTEAEADDKDPSQRPGVVRRAGYVSSMLSPFLSDERDVDPLVFLRDEIAADLRPGPDRNSFSRMMTNLDAAQAEYPQWWMQAWVRTGKENPNLDDIADG